jgi:HPt (histidine-containing phosphotransfer) domain-containing protein
LSGPGAADTTAVGARLIELTRKFVTRTAGDVAQMRAALDSDSGLEQIRQLAHRACGTGGSLGLIALSDAAGELERLVESLPGSPAPGAAERTRIAAGIDAIAAQLVSPEADVHRK